MTTETTKARIERLLELDAKRTPGTWKAEQFCQAPATEKTKAIDSWKIRPIQHRVLGSIDRGDAMFIAASTNTMNIINELTDRLAVAELFIQRGIHSGHTRDDAMAACDLEEAFGEDEA